MENSGNKVGKINMFADNKNNANSSLNLFEISNSNQPLAMSNFNQHKLNDYDSSLLNSRPYLDFDDETAKLEFQITEKEKNLEFLREKIKGAEQIAKVNEVVDLKIQEKSLEKELIELNQQYSKRSLKSKMKDSIKNKNENFTLIDKFQHFVSRKILPKVSKKFEKITHLSSSLDTLKSINQNIDELIDLKVPYGEQTQNYEKLTAYLCRANKIHSQISKSMQKFK